MTVGLELKERCACVSPSHSPALDQLAVLRALVKKVGNLLSKGLKSGERGSADC